MMIARMSAVAKYCTTVQHSPLTQSTLLTGGPCASFVLSKLLSSLWVSRTGSASDWCALQEALYKCIDTIRYNRLWKMQCPDIAQATRPSCDRQPFEWL